MTPSQPPEVAAKAVSLAAVEGQDGTLAFYRIDPHTKAWMAKSHPYTALPASDFATLLAFASRARQDDEPVAWGVVGNDGKVRVTTGFYTLKSSAEKRAERLTGYGGRWAPYSLVPVYLGALLPPAAGLDGKEG